MDKNCAGRWNHCFRRGQIRGSLKGAGNVSSCNEEFITAWTLLFTVLEAFTKPEEQRSDWKVVALTALRTLYTSLGSTGSNCFQLIEQDLSPGISQWLCTTLGFHECVEYTSHLQPACGLIFSHSCLFSTILVIGMSWNTSFTMLETLASFCRCWHAPSLKSLGIAIQNYFGQAV